MLDIGPPCAPWCTTQGGGAQCRLMVHNVVLYSVRGAQCRSHKTSQSLRLMKLLLSCSVQSAPELGTVNLHSEKIKMNEEIDSFLSEKVSNLLLT